MAFDRAKAIEKVENLQFQIAVHLIKTQMYYQSSYIQHWYNELNGWLHTIQRFKLKRTKKPLPKDVLYHILFIEPMEYIDQIQSEMNKLYRDYPTLNIDEPDARVVHKAIEAMMNSICEDLAGDVFYDIRDYLHDLEVSPTRL